MGRSAHAIELTKEQIENIISEHFGRVQSESFEWGINIVEEDGYVEEASVQNVIFWQYEPEIE